MTLRDGPEGLLRTHLVLYEDTALLRCSGEIDVANVSAWESALARAVNMPAAVVLVDLWEVHFLDCAALRALAKAQQTLAREGKILRVRAGPWIQHLLHLTRLDSVSDPDLP